MLGIQEMWLVCPIQKMHDPFFSDRLNLELSIAVVIQEFKNQAKLFPLLSIVTSMHKTNVRMPPKNRLFEEYCCLDPWYSPHTTGLLQRSTGWILKKHNIQKGIVW